MSIVLYRVDDRLIHGQVVVGWGQPLDIGFIVLVDDEVAASVTLPAGRSVKMTRTPDST